MFIFLQVIAREDKGEIHGIDYKYSDMITNYGNGANNIQPQTPLNTANSNSQVHNNNYVHYILIVLSKYWNKHDIRT